VSRSARALRAVTDNQIVGHLAQRCDGSMQRPMRSFQAGSARAVEAKSTDERRQGRI